MSRTDKICECGRKLAYVIYDLYYCSICDRYYSFDGKQLQESSIENISYSGKHNKPYMPEF